MDDLVQAIRAHQSPGGAFLSLVRLPFGDVEDRNCFVTALVLRELVPITGNAVLDDAKRQAFAFLLRSKYPSYRHLFSFYPHRSHPFWMTNALYADADDTSVILLETVRAGHTAADALSYAAGQYFLTYRAVGDLRRHLTQDWQRDGVFLTWLTSADVENPIDCCVNTNVVGMLAAARLSDLDGYAAACSMINDCAEQTARRPALSREFTPFYPHPVEWYYALRHAVDAGAHELAPAQDHLGTLDSVQSAIGTTTPLCSDTAGNIVWTAEVLTLARQLRAQMVSRSGL